MAIGALRPLRLAVCLLGATALGTMLFRPGTPPPKAAFETIDTGGLPELRSHDGLLRATLIAAPQLVRFGNLSFSGAAFNHAYGGPVLRVRPGDRVQLHLVNHMPDAINLHFHGLRITPLGTGDNMHILVPAGTSYDYDFVIPASHPPGLFWYHDHAHRAAEAHVNAGLSGALVIDGFASQFRLAPAVAQKLLVLKDWSQPGCAGGILKSDLHCRIVSINGGSAWHATLPLNGSQLWRICNQGANLILHLSAPGLRLQVIGRDGLPATSATQATTLDILPASRIDVLVQAQSAGKFVLIANGVPTGRGAQFSIKRQLGTIDVAGPPATPAPQLSFPAQADLRQHKVDRHRLVVFAENATATQYYVNGRQFDPARTDFTTPLGSLEEWTITNTSEDFHEFHIHQLAFQVTAINGVAQAFGGFVDDVQVPVHGSVTLLIPFTDPHIVGHFMFHCHVLNHEDRGMMASIAVTAPGAFHMCRATALP